MAIVSHLHQFKSTTLDCSLQNECQRVNEYAAERKEEVRDQTNCQICRKGSSSRLRQSIPKEAI